MCFDGRVRGLAIWTGAKGGIYGGLINGGRGAIARPVMILSIDKEGLSMCMNGGSPALYNPNDPTDSFNPFYLPLAIEEATLTLTKNPRLD